MKRSLEYRLQEKAGKYTIELEEAMLDALNSESPSRKYTAWNLQDCYEMRKFYQLILNGDYKKAFNKLRKLGKEAGLVPPSLEKDLIEMFSDCDYPSK